MKYVITKMCFLCKLKQIKKLKLKQIILVYYFLSQKCLKLVRTLFDMTTYVIQ